MNDRYWEKSYSHCGQIVSLKNPSGHPATPPAFEAGETIKAIQSREVDNIVVTLQ
jgi:hypothetical protein